MSNIIINYSGKPGIDGSCGHSGSSGSSGSSGKLYYLSNMCLG